MKRGPADRGTLKLEIAAEDVAIERDFEQAFPAYAQKLWDLVYPSGKLKTHIKLTWNPGSKPHIEVPDGDRDRRGDGDPLVSLSPRSRVGPVRLRTRSEFQLRPNL